MNDDGITNPIALKIRQILSEHVGVEPADINDEDSFMDDLHMKPTELTDFLEVLTNEGIDTSDLDLSAVTTVSELIEALSSHVYTE